jgi:GNAT superfamily N-acetyltransferase
MILQAATGDDFGTVKDIVRKTIEKVYASFYPEDVVRFFLDHHADEKIKDDIDAGKVYILSVDGEPIGTGTVHGNEICRVFVLPEYHHRGYGTLIMKELETVVARTHRFVRLDSSLPGYGLYLKLGYRPINYQMISTPNGQVLCFHVMEKALVRAGNRISADADAGVPHYEGRRFSPRATVENGESSAETVFNYHQEGADIWADYSGGAIIRGFLLGTVGKGGELDFAYEHLNRDREIRTGRCHSTPEILLDGRIRLHESWSWTNGDCSSGESTLDELV